MGMAMLVISEDATSEDLAPLALAINEIVRLPVTIRSANKPGVRVEKGKVLNGNYTGPVLEEVLKTGRSVRIIPGSGAFKGTPVAVSPIVSGGKTIAAIGIVDLAGTIDLPEVLGAYTDIVRQVEEKR